jgi:hypothetical protein
MSRFPPAGSDNDNAGPKNPREERAALEEIDEAMKREQRRLCTSDPMTKQGVDKLRRSVDENMKSLRAKRARLLRGRA